MKYLKPIIRLAVLLLLTVCSQTVKAQMYIMVHKTDGDVLKIAVSDVDSVTFREITGPEVTYDYVDMGLSVMWATCNIGATSPEQYGSYFAWGETNVKNEYTPANYKWYDATGAVLKYNIWKSLGSVDMKYRLDADDDVAHVLMGDGWHIPTLSDYEELLNNSRVTIVEMNGVKGLSLTSQINDNSIFIPLAGEYWKGDTLGAGVYSYYPTNTLVCYNEDNSSYIYSFYANTTDGRQAVGYSTYNRVGGLPVRPVYSPKTTFDDNVLSVSGVVLYKDSIMLEVGESNWIDATVTTNSDIYLSPHFISSNDSVASVTADGQLIAVGPGECVITASWGDFSASCVVIVSKFVPVIEYVDLGLSVKWATCNVGASSPEKSGGNYAWGEIVTKSEYVWTNYKHCIGTYNALTKYVWNSGHAAETTGVDNKLVLDPEDDVASVLWGDGWRMPTNDEFIELVNNCTWNWINAEGYSGYKVTSNVPGYEGNYIFLPSNSEYGNVYYWTSDLSMDDDRYAMSFAEGECDTKLPRLYGFNIRPVIGSSVEDIKGVYISRSELPLALNAVYEIKAALLDSVGKVLDLNQVADIVWTTDDADVAVVENGLVKAVGPGTCTIVASYGEYSAECYVTVEDPYDVEPESVDLGLSVNWATFNIGAFSPEMTGDFFAWGDVEPYYESGYAESVNPVWKDGKTAGYTWASYKWAEYIDEDGSYSITKYGKDGKTVLEADDDAANHAWGGEWRMPDQIEFEELQMKCTWEFVIADGFKGYKVTSNVEGYTDKSIFLPITESRSGQMLYSEGEGYYWSRNVNTEDPFSAWYLYMNEEYESVWNYYRCQGRTVRPVCPSETWQGITSIEFDSTAVDVALGYPASLSYRILSGSEDYSFMGVTSWTSSDESVVTVNEYGVLNGIKEGVATITAYYNELYAECQVSVKKLSDTNPELVFKVYNDMYVKLGAPGSCGYYQADDFGFIMIAFSGDVEGSDLFLPYSGYNWFNVCGNLTSRTGNYRNAAIRYKACYNTINQANRFMSSFDEDSDDPQVQAMIGEAHALRAFAYLNLAPYYQVSYTSSDEAKNLPCVPLLTLESDPSNNPRATLQEVYDQIISDLNTAIEKLDGWQRIDKSRIDQQVAYGLRARAYLNMGMWSEAAADAAIALRGYEPASITDVSAPFLYDLSESNWMWGYDMNDSLANEMLYATSSSWIRSFSGDSYSAGVGVYSMINSDLYDLIPSSDVRKGWWVNENLYSPLLDSLKSWGDLYGQEIASGTVLGEKERFLPYTNVKFGVKSLGTTKNDEDWCWMRAEEMILIRAEALAKSGNADAASRLLTGFVTSYRDPDYDIEGRGLSLEDEIWFQRRVELWGEGFSNNDIRRLNKPLVRFHDNNENNCPDAFRLNMSADNGWWLMRFPSSELERNAALEDNTGGSIPYPGENGNLLDGVTDYCANGGGYDDEPYLSIYPRKLDMYAGDIYSLSFKTNTGETVVWTSTDDNVATVDKYGVVTAVAEGHCTITATAGELSAECGVVVMPEYHDTVSAVYDFIISEDSLAAEFFYFEDCYGYEVSAEFGESDSGVVCTSIICSITFSSADEAQEAYANMTKGLTDSFIDSLDVVFNDEGTGFSYTNPEMIGMDRDAVLARMYQSYKSMVNSQEYEEGEEEEFGYIGEPEPYLPAGYADSTAIAAWYTNVNEEEGSIKIESVFLFEDGTLVATKSKFYTYKDGRKPEYGINGYGTYELTDGDFYNGAASVVLSDGTTFDVEIEEGVMLAMGEYFFIQDNDEAPEPME